MLQVIIRKFIFFLFFFFKGENGNPATLQEMQKSLQIHLEQHQPALFIAALSVTNMIPHERWAGGGRGGGSQSRQATPPFRSEWPSHQLMLWNVSEWMFNMRTKCSPKSNHLVLEWDQGWGVRGWGAKKSLACLGLQFFSFLFSSFESFKRDVFNWSPTTIAFSFAILSFLPEESREPSVFILIYFLSPFAAFE